MRLPPSGIETPILPKNLSVDISGRANRQSANGIPIMHSVLGRIAMAATRGNSLAHGVTNGYSLGFFCCGINPRLRAMQCGQSTARRTCKSGRNCLRLPTEVFAEGGLRNSTLPALGCV
ncbi:MAG TPA: hypothetical protein VNZ94_06810 [Xanthobacteraceae bacterium]|nr:hypothetical protein [Xanthobacteraceae bacterium]